MAGALEEARLDLGWSQQLLSERASALGLTDVTQTTVSRMLRGKVPMQVGYAEALAIALGMNFSALCRLAEGRVPADTRVMPVRPEEAGPAPNDGRRRRPRHVTRPRP